MRSKQSRILGALAFALGTLIATGVLVAAGLNEETNPVADRITCDRACDASHGK